jgi:predicted ribonuclease YlaK
MLLILSIAEYSQSLDEIDKLKERQNKLANLIEKQKKRLDYLAENKKTILNEHLTLLESYGEEKFTFYENKAKQIEFNFKKRYFDHILVFSSNK